MTGIIGKIKNIFGGKRESSFEEPPTRLHGTKTEEKTVEDDSGQRWKTAKKWREDKEMDEPLIKRKRF